MSGRATLQRGLRGALDSAGQNWDGSLRVERINFRVLMRFGRFFYSSVAECLSQEERSCFSFCSPLAASQTGDEKDFLRVNHYLCTDQTGRPLLPSSTLPPSLSHRRDRHLPLPPPFKSTSLLFFSHTPGFIMKRTSRHRTNNSLPALLKPDSCFLIKSKQPLSELLPRYLTPGETLNQSAALSSDWVVGGHGGSRSHVWQVESVKRLPHMWSDPNAGTLEFKSSRNVAECSAEMTEMNSYLLLT